MRGRNSVLIAWFYAVCWYVSLFLKRRDEQKTKANSKRCCNASEISKARNIPLWAWFCHLTTTCRIYAYSKRFTWEYEETWQACGWGWFPFLTLLILRALLLSHVKNLPLNFFSINWENYGYLMMLLHISAQSVNYYTTFNWK